ncbi:hypothetical protein F5883DRAFT_699492 [Diaporthe sp. PMI_573]|nr:hypothetical protein F5883DRAFT_699492 [Diaporthaceae sp. PMI_573]
MGSAYEDIISSDIFAFVIGPNSKEYKVHGTAISRLSKPLSVLLNGNMREAKEKCVKWPDVEEKTFVRFTQWAYTKTYVTEEPEILCDSSLIQTPIFPTVTKTSPAGKAPERPLYSLAATNLAPSLEKDCCWNSKCASYGTRNPTSYNKFLDESGTVYPSSGSGFSPRKNTKGCEDYTGVFLCHAKLYVMADTYDIPLLKQLSLHRLHATLKEFNLYPSRMNDISTLAKYVFENTVPQDKIRDMITLYYTCIVEDVRKQDGLKSLIEEIPDFAFGLISKMSDRLA